MSVQLVIFTGAGFSKAIAGLPTTIDIMGDKENPQTGTIRKDFQSSTNDDWRLPEYLEIILAEDHPTLDAEVLARKTLDYIEAMDFIFKADEKLSPELSFYKRGIFQLESASKSPENIHIAARSLLNHIHRTLMAKLNYNGSDEERFDPVTQFFEQIQQLKLSFNIYSTNYDILFSCFSSNLTACVEGIKVDIDKLIKSEGLPYSYIPLKGTMEWGWDSKKEHVLDRQRASQSFENSVFLGLEVIADRNYIENQFPFNKLYKQFERDLKNAKYLLFIGFSFRDNYINSLIQENIKRYEKIIIVCHESKGEVEVFRNYLRETTLKECAAKQLVFINTGFNDKSRKEIINILRGDDRRISLPL